MSYVNSIIHGDCIKILKTFKNNSIHCIISDIPYGISYDKWDVLHDNKNSALLGSSPAQKKAGKIFKNRGKPLNGWSEADTEIAKEYYQWCRSWTNSWFNILKPCGSAFIFAGRRYQHRVILAMERTGFIFKDMIAWEKKAPFRSQRVSAVFERRGDSQEAEKWEGWRLGNLRPAFEPVLWFMKPYKIGTTIADNLIKRELGAFNLRAWERYTAGNENIISVKVDKNDHGLHPTQKPLKLMKALIRLITVKNQIVLDPFCGSGTTCVAAGCLGRRWIGIEKNEEFVYVAKNRIKSEM